MARGGTDVKELLLRFNAQTELARREVRELRDQIDRDTDKMDRDLDKVDKASGKLGDGFSKLKGLAGGIALGALGAGLLAAGRNALEFADNLEAAAARAGIDIERYQTLTRALRTLEVDGADAEKMFIRLQGVIGDVQNGVDNNATKALDRLGIRARILRGEIDDPAEALDALSEASTRAGTQAQFAGELSEIAGAKLAGKFTPALYGGTEALHDLEQQARASGIMTAEMSAQLSAANERIDVFTESVQYLSAISLANTIGWFEKLFRTISEYGAEANVVLGRLNDQQPDAMNLLRATNPIMNLVAPGGWTEQGGRDRLAGIQQGRANDMLRGVLGPLERIFPARRTFTPTGETSSGGRGGGSSRSRTSDRSNDVVRPSTGDVLSPFGADRSGVPLNGRLTRRSHQGVDLAGNIGDPVVAPFAGTARRGVAPGGLGNYVKITDGNGRETILGHLNGFEIPEEGRRVNAGELVGRLGRSGNATRPDGTGTPHLHWQLKEGGRNIDPLRRVGAGGGNAAERAAQQAEERRAREAAQLAERQRRNAEEMDREIQGASERLLSARRSAADTEGERARLAIEMIRSDLAKADEEARRDAERRIQEDPINVGRYVLHQTELMLLNKRVADEEARQVVTAEQRRIEEQAAGLRETELSEQRTLLQLRADLTGSVQERHSVEQQLLALAQQQEREELKRLALSQDENAARQAQLRLRYLDEKQGLEREGLNRSQEGPRARYMRELRGGMSDIDTRLEQLEVDAIRGLEDELVGAAQAALGLSGALGGVVAELIRIGIQQSLLALSDAVGGGQGKSSGGGGILSSILSLVGLGSSGGGKGSGIAAAGIDLAGALGKREFGGPVEPGSAYLVGERRPEIFVPRTAGTIIPRVPSITVPRGQGGGGAIHNHYHMTGNLMTPEFWAQIHQGDQLAAARGAGGGAQRIYRSAERRIP
ncbi:MAG TPA: peptidoglycan DD-metalloendopeptidase family protein [Allosphingosinicella sp.]|jgi:murein DD-endopeptidase MepM/ murein hydrolase activator NlpD